MHWVYERVLSHKGVNYHLWSAEQDGRSVFALTRTAALAPSLGTYFSSLEEVVWKTGVSIDGQPAPTSRPLQARQATGIFRTSDGWARVEYSRGTGPIPRDLYVTKGYEPAYEELPTEAEYRASNVRAAER